jgi:hypothetical protein
VLGSSLRAGTLPSIHAQTFDDVSVNLPSDLNGKVGVLVLGFSRKSGNQTKQWTDALSQDYGHDPHVAYYQCAMLAEVPGFIRGMVIKQIRGSMSSADRSHFIALVQDLAKWKQAAQFSGPDDSYVLVFDGAGQIQARFHGAETPESYGRLRDAIEGLQNRH